MTEIYNYASSKVNEIGYRGKILEILHDMLLIKIVSEMPFLLCSETLGNSNVTGILEHSLYFIISPART